MLEHVSVGLLVGAAVGAAVAMVDGAEVGGDLHQSSSGKNAHMGSA